DAAAIKVSTIDGNNIRVTGPNGFNVLASLVGIDTPGDGSPRIATYRFTAPGGTWDGADAGAYAISIEANQVADTNGKMAAPTTFGSFIADMSPTRVVPNANDSGLGSLRTALANANLTSAPDTITFD